LWQLCPLFLTLLFFLWQLCSISFLFMATMLYFISFYGNPALLHFFLWQPCFTSFLFKATLLYFFSFYGNSAPLLFLSSFALFQPFFFRSVKEKMFSRPHSKSVKDKYTSSSSLFLCTKCVLSTANLPFKNFLI